MSNNIEGRHTYPKWWQHTALAAAIFITVVAVLLLLQRDLVYGGLSALMVLVLGLAWYSVSNEGVVVESDRITEFNPWGSEKTVRYEDVRRVWYSPRSFRFSDSETEVTVMTGFQNAIAIAHYVKTRLPDDVVQEGSEEMKHKVELGRDYTLREYAKSSAGVFLAPGILSLSFCIAVIVNLPDMASSSPEDEFRWMLVGLAVISGLSLWLTGMGVWGYYQRWSRKNHQ